jgi:hypothetical protein
VHQEELDFQRDRDELERQIALLKDKENFI